MADSPPKGSIRFPDSVGSDLLEPSVLEDCGVQSFAACRELSGAKGCEVAITDYESVIRKSLRRYLDKHPGGDPCSHLVDLCPILETVAPDRQFAVTNGHRFLYYRAGDGFDLDISAGMQFPELPEIDPIQRTLASGETCRACIPEWVYGQPISITSMPILDAMGKLRGCFVVFEGIDRERSSAFARHQELVRKLSALHQFNGALGLLASEGDLWDRMMQAASTILGYEYCAALLHEHLTDQLVVRHCRGYAEKIQEMRIPVHEGKGLTVHAFRYNRIISVPDVQSDPRYVQGSASVRSELAIPVVVSRQPIGVFSAASSRPGAFSDEDVKLCITLVNQMSMAIERLRLFGQVGASRDVIIFALARLAESRDDDTGGHLERICGYTRTIAQVLRNHPRFMYDMDESFLDDLYRSVALHDIGKVGIPDAILQKPGRLTPDEFEVMKTHTIIGGETLADAEKHLEDLELLRMGKAIAYYHHEKFDGTGYPYGLSGDEIPVAARIACLADVYDALTTRRCYKDAFDHGVALTEITSAAGSHFDPDIVKAFVDAESEILRIKSKYAA